MSESLQLELEVLGYLYTFTKVSTNKIMHSSLSPHLHSPECNEVIALLLQCHKENPVRRFVGFCNKPNYEVVECLKRERETNRALNAEKSKLKREEVQRRLQGKAAEN